MNRAYLVTVGCNRLRHCMRLRSSDLQRKKTAEEHIVTHATRLLLCGKPQTAEQAEAMVASMIRRADEFCP